MRWISKYKKHSILSLSFFIVRINDLLLLFIPLIIIAQSASKAEIAHYGFFSFLFSSLVCISLGFTSGIQYFTVKAQSLREKEDAFLASIVLMVLTFIFAALIYIIYISIFIRSYEISNSTLYYIFLVAILPANLYCAISSYNQAILSTRTNNISSAFALPVFFCIFFVLKNEFNILLSCAIAFSFTRLIMLSYVIHDKLSLLKRIETFKISFVKKIFNFGVSISSLFFIQKFIEVIALNLLGNKNIEVTSYQMILSFSLIFGLLSNAIATNAFIHIAQNISVKTIYENLIISFFNILLVFLLSLFLIGLNWKTILSFAISDYDLANELRLSLKTIILFIFTQMISVNFVIIIRSIGETWRARIIWCLCMIVGLMFYKNNIEYKIILHITILANLITSFFAIFWIIKNNLYIQKLKKLLKESLGL